MENNKIKILLVEDDPFLIDIYSNKLREAGFNVVVSTDGNEVVQKAKEEKPNVVLLDIVLPSMDGWEILRHMQDEGLLEKSKVIILSNLAQPSEVNKGINMGAIKYLIKAHYTPSEVVQEVEKTLAEQEGK